MVNVANPRNRQDTSALVGTIPGPSGTSKVGAKALEPIAWMCIQSCANNNLFYQVGVAGSEGRPRCKGLKDQSCFTFTSLASCQTSLGLDPGNGVLRGVLCPTSAAPGWCTEATKQLINKGLQTTCSTPAVALNFTYCALEYVAIFYLLANLFVVAATDCGTQRQSPTIRRQ